jgi:uncharacterized DUF497 family protein
MGMKIYEWDKEKNDKLKKERGISFEEIVAKIIAGDIVDITDNPSVNFPKQKIYVIKIDEYIYYVPHVADEVKIFLKTIIPSRKATKKYLTK